MKRIASLGVFFLAVSLTAQTIYKPPSTTISPTYCSDKIAVQMFSATPAPAQPGQEVSVSMTIKNRCTSAMDVPWRIAKNNIVLGQGIISALAGGASNTVVAKWTAVAGDHHFYGDADPNNSLGDSSRANNVMAQDMMIQPRKATEILDYNKARDAQARFNFGLDAGMQCDAAPVRAPYSSLPFGTQPFSVVLQMDCQKAFIGGKASPEAFSGFTLKNGWVVKSLDRIEECNPTTCPAGSPNNEWEQQGKCSAQFEVRPQEGTKNPYTKMRVWSISGFGIKYLLRITVEGPEGTSPYVCQAGVDCNTGLPL